MHGNSKEPLRDTSSIDPSGHGCVEAQGRLHRAYTQLPKCVDFDDIEFGKFARVEPTLPPFAMKHVYTPSPLRAAFTNL